MSQLVERRRAEEPVLHRADWSLGMWLWMNLSQFHCGSGQGWCGNLLTESSAKGWRVRNYPLFLLRNCCSWSLKKALSWIMGDGKQRPAMPPPGSLLGCARKNSLQTPLASATSSFHRSSWKGISFCQRGTLRKEIGFPADLNGSGLESCVFWGLMDGDISISKLMMRVPWLRA